MKDKKEDLNEITRDEKLNKILKKNEIAHAQLKLINDKKNLSLKNLEKMKEERLKQIQDNLYKATTHHELNRKSVELRINHNLEKISFNHKTFYNNQNRALHEKNAFSLNKFHTNFENLQTEKNFEFEKIRDRPIEKYEKWVKDNK